MNLSKTNKTLILCSVFIAGISAYVLNLSVFFLVLTALSGLVCCKNKLISSRFLSVCIILALFSTYYTYYRTPRPDKLSRIAPISTKLAGQILTDPELSKNKARFVLAASKYEISPNKWQNISGKTLISSFGETHKLQNLKSGDTVEITGKVKLPFKANNPGEFNYSGYLANSGIFTITQTNNNNIKLVKHPDSVRWMTFQKISAIKDRILFIHKKFVKSPNLEILGGVVFGDHAVPTPKDIEKNFINSGLMHVLAASGMNIAIIYGIWFFIASKLLVPYRVNVFIGSILVLIYAVLTGLPPSVVRATVMLEFILFGKLIDRKADTLTLLAFVCGLMLLCNPYLITNIGFQLSFLVTFGLLLCTNVILEKLKPVPEVISGIVVVPLIAQLWALPIQAYHFNTVPSYSIIANIFAVPLVTLISGLGFASSLSALLPIIGEKICSILDYIANPLISALLYISKTTASLPGAINYVSIPSIISIIGFYSMIIFITIQLKVKTIKKRIISCLAASIILLAVPYLHTAFDNSLKFTFFSVGEADSILIQTPFKENIIVDTGNTGNLKFNPANSIIIPYLRDLGINKLDKIILTHPDKDHIGGTIDILKEIGTNELIENGQEGDSKYYLKLKKYILSHKTPVTIVKRKYTVSKSKNFEITAIKPNTNNNDHNENSIILFVKYNNFSALLMGDSEADSLKYIKPFIKSQVNVIKVGHHGSYNSINQSFINYFQPQIAVISVGKNKYHHPSNQTLNILKLNNIKSFRTDKDSAIRIRTNGKSVEIEKFNKDRP